MRRAVRAVISACALLALLWSPAPLLLAQTKQEGPPPLQLKVGEKVPDFSLRDQNGKDVALHDLLGKKNVVLAFYVFAFTGG